MTHRDIMTNCPLNSPGFIVGSARSGTTLVAAILNRHSLVYITPETHFFNLINQSNELKEQLTDDWPNSYNTYISYLSDVRRDNAQDIMPTALEVWPHSQSPTIKEIFNGLGSALANKSAKHIWLEKTPGHLKHLHEIRLLFPKSPIIQIIRDGRDVAESLRHVFWGSSNYFINLLKWINESEQCSKWIDANSHCITVKYEDVLSNSTKEVSRLCEFLKIDYSPNLLTPSNTDSHLIEKGSNHKALISKPIKKSNSKKWESSLTDKQKQLSIILAYSQLKKFSYINNTQENSISFSSSLFKKIHKSDLHNILIELNRLYSIYSNGPSELYECRSKFFITEENPLITKNITPAKLLKSLFKLSVKRAKRDQTKIIWVYNKKPSAWRIIRLCDHLFGFYVHKIVVTNNHADTTRAFTSFMEKKILHSNPTVTEKNIP